MPTAILTGVTGGWGRAVLDRFLERGWDVCATTRNADADLAADQERAARPPPWNKDFVEDEVLTLSSAAALDGEGEETPVANRSQGSIAVMPIGAPQGVGNLDGPRSCERCRFHNRLGVCGAKEGLQPPDSLSR